jgi:hypothetical protein
MTDAVGGAAPPDEAKRSVIENAILAFRPDLVDQYQLPAPPPKGQALMDLANAANIPRLIKHRRLIDGLRRNAAEDQPTNLDEEARYLLESTVGQGLPDDRRPDLVDQAKRRLDEVTAAPGAPQLQPQHWQLWVQSTNATFQFAMPEQTFQACNDQQLVMKATPDGELVLSRLLFAQFWSDRPPTDFRRFVDPHYWPDCSSFWRQVKELQPEVQTADGFDWDFEETVDLLGETLVVPLHVGVRELPDHSRVWTRFNISGQFYDANTPVDVDTGTISAELIPGGPARTRVQAIKYLHWRDPRRTDPTAEACEFGWAELIEEMADGCAQGPPAAGPQAQAAGAGAQAAAEGVGAQAAAAGADGAKTPVDAAITQLVKEVTTEWQQGIVENGPILEQLMRRFTGSSWDAGWVNDLLGMALVTARHYGNIAGDVLRFADSLRDAPTERDGHG